MKDFAKNNQLVLIIVAVLLVIWFIAPLRKLFGNVFGGVDKAVFGEGGLFGKTEADALTDTLVGDVAATNIDTTYLTKPATFYSSWVAVFYDRMQGAQGIKWSNYFTDDEYAELNTLTANDLKQIFKSFGVKTNKGVDAFNWIDVGNKEGTLIQWLQDELSPNEAIKMKAIWTKTGLW